jgi:aminoglycoside phosphotransferase (APT) family kinase protein
VSGLIEVDGRPGVLFERVFGDSLLDSIMSNQDRAVDHAVAFADLHTEILNVSSAKDLPGVKEFMAGKIDDADLPMAQRTLAKDHMMGLPDGNATLHGDYHPGDILVTPDGPKVIDWGEASRGDAAADIARTMVLLTPESAAVAVPHPGTISTFISDFANAYIVRCLQVTSATIETITAWRLPVIAAWLSEGIAEQTGLLQAEVAKLACRNPRP